MGLMLIARKLATADSTTGLEKDGKDEIEDAKALRNIANALLKLTGLPAATGASGTGGSGSSGASGSESGSSGASGSESGSSGASGPAPSKLLKLHQKVSDLEKVLGLSGPESDSPSGASG